MSALPEQKPGVFARQVALIERHWRIMLAVVIVATGVLLYTGRNIGVDNALQIWFIDGDPVLEKWDSFRERFGNDEFVVIGVTDPSGVYSPASLERIRTASKKLEDHPKVRRVTSVGVSRHIDGDAVEIVTEPLLPDGALGPDATRVVRERLALNPVFDKTIATASDKMTLLVVELETLRNLDQERPVLLAELRAIATAELRKDGGGYHMSGMGVVYEGLNAASLRDSAIFLTLSYLIVLVGLWLLFRRLLWVAVGAGIVTLAILTTIGIAGTVGRDLNMVTAVLPTLLMVIGILDLVHLVDSYDEAGLTPRTPKRAFLTAIGAVAAPCLFNSITDIAGFASLASAPMSAIRDFGWLTAVGLALLYVVLMIVVVPVLARYGARKGGARPEVTEGAIVRATEWLFDFASRRYRAILVGTGLLFAVSLVGVYRLTIDTYTIGFLHDGDPVRKDHDAIERDFGKFVAYEFLVTTPEPGGIKDPDVMKRLERAERAMEQHPDVSRVTGLPEIVSRLNQVVFDGEAKEYRIPDTREAIAQEILLYENDERNDLELLVDNQFQVARITARSGMPSVTTVGEIIDSLENTAQGILGDKATIEGVGYMAVYVRVIKNIAVTQVSSFGTAILFISLALMLFLRSFRLGLLALIPNILPVAMILGFMGFAGIDLDVATVLIASIVIGLAVNDTTHMFFRFRDEMIDHGKSAAEACRATMRGTGRAIIASSLILAAGFFVLVFASVKSISYFGLLTMVATLFALVSDLIITPALLVTVRFSGRTAPRPTEVKS